MSALPLEYAATDGFDGVGDWSPPDFTAPPPPMMRPSPAGVPVGVPHPMAVPAGGGAPLLMRAALAEPVPASAVDVSGSTDGPVFGPMPPLAAYGENPPPPQSVPQENGHSLGLTLLILSIGSAVGVQYGGVWGGVAGALYGGAAVNLIRSARCATHGTPESDKEAIVSGTYAVVSGGIASYLLWKTKGTHAAERDT